MRPLSRLEAVPVQRKFTAALWPVPQGPVHGIEDLL
jgi:hypothetical protein